MDAIVVLVKESSKYVGAPEVALTGPASHNWITIDQPGFTGKFIIDTEAPVFESKLSPKTKVDFEAWMREMTSVVLDTEIDVQLGEFTVKRHTISPLEKEFTRHEEFRAVFAHFPNKDSIQCAEVRHLSNRKWVRLVGLGYDLQLWNIDKRQVQQNHMNIPYQECKIEWVKEVLDPWKKSVFPKFILHTSSTYTSSSTAVMFGAYIDGHGGAGTYVTADSSVDLAHAGNNHTLQKEVIVYRYPPLVHVFDVVEYGRRFYRRLVFSSSAYLSYCDLESEVHVINNIQRNSCGKYADANVEKSKSLVIIREHSVENNAVKNQYYVPHYLLTGLIPQCVLEQYQFWQNEDDSLTGYTINCGSVSNETTASKSEPSSSSKHQIHSSRSILHINLSKDGSPADTTGFGNSSASALSISRVFVMDDSEEAKRDPFRSIADPSKPAMYLLNALSLLATFGNKVPSSSQTSCSPNNLSDIGSDDTLHSLLNLLLRLDSLSHIALWSKTEPSPGSAVSIDAVELPYLRLTFEKVGQSDGSVRYMCVEQSGFCLALSSSYLDIEPLLEGIPNGVILTNAEQELFVLVPSICKPTLLQSKHNKYNCELILDPCDAQWIRNSGESTYFLYPLHISGSMLITKSVASALLLLLYRLIGRNYKGAIKLTRSCVWDRILSPQEKQIYYAIGQVNDTLYPDAYACRLRLYFSTFGCRDKMPYFFHLPTDMNNYVLKRSLVSSECRLTPVEEAFIMSQIAPGVEGVDYLVLSNHEALLRASFDVTLGTASQKPSVKQQVALQYPPQYEGKSFIEDHGADLASLDASKAAQFKALLSKVSMNKYTRPEECNGPQALQFLSKVVEEGVDIKGKGSGFGFIFLYELMNNSLAIKILPDDSSHGLGAALFRLMSDDADPMSNPQSWAILKIMAEHPRLAADMPVFEDKRKLKLFGSSDLVQNHIKAACAYIVSHGPEIKTDLVNKVSSPIYLLPKSFPALPVLEEDRNSIGARAWLSPIIYDFNRSKLSMSTTQIPAFLAGTGSSLSSSDMVSLLTFPFQSMHSSGFVEIDSMPSASLGDDGKLNNPDKDFDVLQHPSSRSHIAR